MTAKKTAKRRVAIYLRVSTDGQTTENQRRELEAVAKRSGWHVVGVYEDQGVSGSKGRDGRKEFDRLCNDAARREFDMVAAWSVDRLGRSLQHLVGFLEELRALKVDLYLHQQAVDTTTPAGRALFQMLGVFAEFERSIIRERVVAGLERAKAKGVRLGAPKGLSNASRKVRNKVLAMRADGVSIRGIAQAAGIAPNTVLKVLRDAVA
jgi:DNA invertase Pin-like site-specific DNA recombinase